MLTLAIPVRARFIIDPGRPLRMVSATMCRGRCVVATQRKKFGKKNGWGLGRRGRRLTAGFSSEAAFAAPDSAVEARCPDGGCADFAAALSGVGSGAAKAAASESAGGALRALPRGQLKSSARPLGAAAGSP